MKLKLIAILCSGIFLMTGCGGGSDSQSSADQGTPGGNNQNNESSEAQVLAKVETSSGIALRETLMEGIVDTLVYGMDEIGESVPCKTGSWKQTGTVITLDKCTGIFESEASAVANGSIDVSAGYNFQDLNLAFPDGTTQIIKGKLLSTDSEILTQFKSDQIDILVKEPNGKGGFQSVSYVLSDYQLDWTPQGTADIKNQVKGKVKSTGREGGDINIAFDNSATPYLFKTDADGEVVGYPYSGVLNIQDLTDSTSTISISYLDAQSAIFKAIVKNKLLFDKTATWESLLEL
jgi:hypothetical protein